MVNLFTGLKGFEDFAKQVDKANALKRGCYSKKPKTIDPYLELQNIYTYLAGFFERPTFPEQEDEVIYLSGFKLSIVVYSAGTYQYEGNIYQTEPFIEAQAELDGTQYFSFEERLDLHREVQTYLKTGDTLEVAYSKVKEKILHMQCNYKKREDGGWRKLILGTY